MKHVHIGPKIIIIHAHGAECGLWNDELQHHLAHVEKQQRTDLSPLTLQRRLPLPSASCEARDPPAQSRTREPLNPQH